MKKLIGITVVAAAFLLITHASTAQAQGFLGNGCSSCVGYGSFGQLGSPYALGRIPVPPYFALHPPVYYSQPIARTYGYSPFAYPGSVRTPEIVAPAASAKTITNPHVTPTKAKKVQSLNLTSTQLEIINPFVTDSSTKMVTVEAAIE